MGWAGHKLTDSGIGKGESEGKSLDNGTCPESLLACDSELVDLEEAGKDTGRPGRSRRRYFRVDNLEVLGNVGDSWRAGVS